MSIDTLPSAEFSQPVKETLSKTQQAVLDRVIAILDSDPKLNGKITQIFHKNFLDIVTNKDKFNLLIEKIDSKMMQQLEEIQKAYDANEKTAEQAKEESKEIIKHYTQIQLSALHT